MPCNWSCWSYRTCRNTCFGLAFYELTAIVLKCGKDSFRKPVSNKINYYYNRLLYWQENTERLELDWISFLLDDNRPNKEKLLSEKQKLKQKSL